MISAYADKSLMILFISNESHQQLIRNFYKVGKQTVTQINTIVNVTASLSEGTLMYSWGSAAHGKLGIGLTTDEECEGVSEFVREDLCRIKINIDDPDSYQYFTFSPQPIVSFLGIKVKSVQAGLRHFLALTTIGELFAWGDNQQCQLGLDDPDQLYPPNHFDKSPVKISMQEQPKDAQGNAKGGANGNNAGHNSSRMSSSNYNPSVNESVYEAEEHYEVVWELESAPIKPLASTEPPKIDLMQLTRATQKTRMTEKQQTWRRVLKFAKVPYKVPTDKQASFGP